MPIDSHLHHYSWWPVIQQAIIIYLTVPLVNSVLELSSLPIPNPSKLNYSNFSPQLLLALTPPRHSLPCIGALRSFYGVSTSP